MTMFTASAQSSSEIEVSWNVEDQDPGYDILTLSITQTAPDGTSSVQNITPPVQIGTTYFPKLQPSTTYNYVIYAAWSDGAGSTGWTYNPQPGISCTTDAQPASGSSKGTGSSSANSVLQLGPITGLTAKWVAPGYNEITVSFTVGANSTGALLQLQGPATYSQRFSIARNAANPSDNPDRITHTFPNVKTGAYTITATETYGSQSNTATYSLAAPPPPALSNVSATWNPDYTAVILSWTLGSGPTTTGMILQRYVGQYSSFGTPPAPVNIPLMPPITDTPPSITSTSQYQYVLTATNAFGQTSAYSNVLSPPTAPAAPSNVVAEWSANTSQVTVTWDAVAHAESYEVVLFTVAGDGPFQSIPQKAGDHPNITSTTFTGPLTAQPSISYQCQIIAHNRFGSNASALTNVDALPVPPPGSQSPSTGAGTGSGSVNLTHTLIQKNAPQEP